MAYDDPNRSSEETPERPPGRVRAAWSVLRGERVVPLQIQAEWIEYQQVLDSLLRRFSALLARQAKAERRAIEQALEVPQSPPSSAPQAEGKLALWRKVHERQPPGAQLSLPALPHQEETA